MSYFESLLSQSGIAVAAAPGPAPVAAREAPSVEPIEVEAVRELGPDGRPLPGDESPALTGARLDPQASFQPGAVPAPAVPQDPTTAATGAPPEAPTTVRSAPDGALGSEAAPPAPPVTTPRLEGAAPDGPRSQPAPGPETRQREPEAAHIGQAASRPPVEGPRRLEAEAPMADSRDPEAAAKSAPAPRLESDPEASGPRTLAEVRTWVAATPAPGEIAAPAPGPTRATAIEATSGPEPTELAPPMPARQRETEPLRPPAPANVSLNIGAIELVVEAPPVPAASPQPPAPQRRQARASGGAGFRLRRHYLRS
jgi:hypothetical protein